MSGGNKGGERGKKGPFYVLLLYIYVWYWHRQAMSELMPSMRNKSYQCYTEN